MGTNWSMVTTELIIPDDFVFVGQGYNVRLGEGGSISGAMEGLLYSEMETSGSMPIKKPGKKPGDNGTPIIVYNDPFKSNYTLSLIHIFRLYMKSTIRCCVFFFKQKTAYEMRESDWSSDVCSSDLRNDDLISNTDSFQ